MKRLFLIFLLYPAVGFANAERWYSDAQVEHGKKVFRQHCAVCHGQNAEATEHWKERAANGFFPPPPLNGTAHAWHHDLAILRRSVREGGQKLGGIMPPFENVLSADEIDAAIAFFQSKWPDDLYGKWSERFKVTATPSLDDVVNALEKQMTQYLKKRLGNVTISDFSKTPLEGVWQVKVQGKNIYLLNNGEFALTGDLIDLKNGVNLSANPQ